MIGFRTVEKPGMHQADSAGWAGTGQRPWGTLCCDRIIDGTGELSVMPQTMYGTNV